MRQPPKTYEQALAEIIRVLTVRFDLSADFIEGSKLYSLAEAMAFQVADLSDRQEASINAAIPEAVYAAFGFARHEAVAAAGSLTFTAPGPSLVPVLIPAGTEAARDDGTVYVTLSEASLDIGERSVTVTAAALTPGATSNTPSATVTRLLTPPPGIQGVTNTLPFVGGKDAETPAEQQARFTQWLDLLDESNITGLTRAVLDVVVPGIGSLHEALVVDGKTDASIPPGVFHAYLYRAGGVPDALKAAAEGVIELRRAAGCIPSVQVVTGTPTPIVADLTVRSLGTVPSARAMLEVYFQTLRFGEKASRENLISTLKNAHPDVLEVTLTSPAEDVPCPAYAHLELGEATLTETFSPTGRPL